MTIFKQSDLNSVRSGRYTSKRTGILIGIVLLTTATIVILRSQATEAPEELLKEARRELIRGNFSAAEALANRVSDSSDSHNWALLTAAEAAVRLNRPADALAYYQQVPSDAGEASLSASFGAAEMMCHLGRLTDSEAGLRGLLAKDPGHTLAHQRLAFILNITGRRWEATEHLLHVIRNNPGEVEPLLLLGSVERMVDAGPLLEVCRQMDPDDPLPLLGEARRALALNQTAQARELLEKIRHRLNAEAELQARWGQLLAESGSFEEFQLWNDGLPEIADAHPEVWIARAAFALRIDQKPHAARCFWEALKRDPEHRSAHYRLGQLLTELGEKQIAEQFLNRADRLQQLALVLDDLFHHPAEVTLMSRAGALTEGLGRLPEAYAWANAAIKLSPGAAWARDIIRRLEPLQPNRLRRTLKETSLVDNIDLSMLPLPSWSLRSQSDAERTEFTGATPTSVSFSDDAENVGINFVYFNSSDAATPGARIFETTGGGVGVLDYDADGWPDLHLTQGCEWPKTAGDGTLLDQIYRNERGHRFRATTSVSGLHEENFSQGVSSGDIDNDGFPDLYVANLGQNRLFRNNGDGTFTDVTDSTGVNMALWTTSCMVADVNHDGNPDLYDVNYADGPQIDTLVCERQGKWRACSPRAFAAASDQLWLNDGQGGFRNATAESGIPSSGGFGLGILAADFRNVGNIDIFIANDEVPNFYFVNQTATDDSPFFTEQAMPSGIAVDGDGASQGCMGIAAADADGDGLTDIFVTNFYNESNTFYRQLVPGLFTDDTRRAGLRDPGFAMLGFGTQFLDGELDGWPDLVVTNGHIDDLSDIGEPWQMAPQYLRNTGSGYFEELSHSQVGPFFAQKLLGRGLARLDWNRDGLEDFAVSHIGTPAALLTNRTILPGNHLCIRLIGMKSSRDSIGTTAEIRIGEKKLSRQLYGGDGYQASNQKILTIGLGTATQVDSLMVRWPSGRIQTWHSIPSNQTLTVVEGSDRTFTLPY